MSRNRIAIFSAGWLCLLAFHAIADTVIIDNRSAGFSVTGTWDTGTYPGYHVTDYRYCLTQSTESATASWTPEFPSAGTYEVFVWYVQGANRPTDAAFTINYAGGPSTVYVDQTQNGSHWFSIGSYDFPTTGGSVVLSNASATAGKAIIADAVRFVRTGTTYSDHLYQGMWVYSWGLGFLSEAQTNDMIAVARANHLNVIFPEIRKTGDAYYISATEPRGSNIDPSYTDPLADILAKAHDTSNGKQYIEVHAWFVPYRVWVSGTPPPTHVLSEHPDWVMGMYDGSTDSQCIDPGVPGVEDYLVDVVTELVQNYDIDGVHFDYFRYPGTLEGYNPVALARFQKLYNRSDRPLPDDPQFSEFRRDQIRAFGRKVYAAVKAIRWNVKMSAATIAWMPLYPDFTQTRTYSEVFQDWPGFMQEGLLDMNVVMNYKREYNTAQAADFRLWTQFLAATKAGRLAVSGPAIYLNSIEGSVTQTLYAMDTPGIDGNNFYVYHLTNKDGDSADDFWATMRNDCLTTRSVPKAPWIETPTQGILRGTVTIDGAPADGTTVTLSSGAFGQILTDGTGFYAFLKANPGTGFTVTASAPGYPDQSKSFDITAGQVTTVDFTFPLQIETPTPTATATPTATQEPSPTASPSPSPTGSTVTDWNAFILR